jgi:hypothetical protein
MVSGLSRLLRVILLLHLGLGLRRRLSVGLSVWLAGWLAGCLSVCLSVYLICLVSSARLRLRLAQEPQNSADLGLHLQCLYPAPRIVAGARQRGKRSVSPLPGPVDGLPASSKLALGSLAIPRHLSEASFCAAAPAPVTPNLPPFTDHMASAHLFVGTACWPCRQRKVKCDNKSPCENCVKREHSQLCSYKPNRSAAKADSFSDSASVSQIRKRPHSPDEQDARSLSNEARESISAYESEAVETRYVGQNSIPALLREQTSANEPEDVNVIRQDMQSLLGLDNSAPFPLMSARHLNRLTSDISSELPSDREVMKYAAPPLPVFRGFRSRSQAL